MMLSTKKRWYEWMWETWCIVSVIGIWPRYIEPKLLTTTRLKLFLPHLPSELSGLTIVHFSDLHWNKQFSPYLQRKLIQKINALQPDLIVFTGDFLSRGQLEDPAGLKWTLQSLKANHGCFAVLGNHDYSHFVTINSKGDYDIDAPSTSPIGKGFKRLFANTRLTKFVTPEARNVEYHTELNALLLDTPFKLLNNTTTTISCKGHRINICGLEEHMLGKVDAKRAFKNYDKECPGIILLHNPDGFAALQNYPGDLILSGHTHGGQINLPGISKRLTLLEHTEYKSGLKNLGKRWGYINRGISSVMKFRCFAPPELTFITLVK